MLLRITEETITFIGFVTKVHPDKWYPKFDIQTQTALLKEIDYRQVEYRKSEDLSWVKIPEELKTKTTQHILHVLKCPELMKMVIINLPLMR
jgi:hypothetical protein